MTNQPGSLLPTVREGQCLTTSVGILNCLLNLLCLPNNAEAGPLLSRVCLLCLHTCLFLARWLNSECLLHEDRERWRRRRVERFDWVTPPTSAGIAART